MSLKEINSIKSEIGVLDEKLRKARKRLQDAGMRHAKLKVGDRILVKKRRGDFHAFVTGFEQSTWGDGRPKAVKAKKDGTPGQSSAGYIQDWEHAPTDT